MINILGPEYRYAGEQLLDPEVILVRDHHYNETDQCFYLEQLLKNSSCDPHKHTVVFDHVLQHDDCLKDYTLVSFPSFLSRENTEFVQQQINPDWSNKTAIFNFMINKPRPHRIMLVKMIEEFDLTNYCHSLAWKNNDVNHVPVTNYRLGNEIVQDRGVRNGSFKNAHTYQVLLQKTVFEPTGISLITEPAFYERETIVTEKTLMAIYGGTMPIWVGGWRIPDYMRSIGIDVFDDVIDHSYQDLADPAERCYTAVQRNIDILRTWHGFSTEQVARLNNNVQLVETNLFTTICHNILAQLPKNIQESLNFKVDKV